MGQKWPKWATNMARREYKHMGSTKIRLLDCYRSHGAKIIIYDHYSQVLPDGQRLVCTRIAVDSPESRTGTIIMSQWVDADPKAPTRGQR